MKPGTRIETLGPHAEPARICRPRPELPGPGRWYLIKFDAGGKLCVHESRFRVIDNARP